FDDLILIPLRLFQQNESILGYWHSQFHHILVDEYQDTNRIQYNLIRLLTTNGEEKKEHWNWQNRSIFVVGDADQSIYSFRQADFTILLGFQTDFGDNLPDDDTRTMVKLEENYRSRENILEAANHLIANNSQRIDKVLRATRGYGEHLYCHKASNEQEEARFCIHKMLQLKQDNPELNWGDLAILYRMNAQSRAFEDILRQNNIPYNIIGGLKFYDRKEIKDALAYLRVLVNPADTVSLLRIINTPRRGIGQSTVNNLISASQELGMPLWEILIDQTSVNTLAGRAAKKVNQFAQMMQQLQVLLANWRGSQILAEVFEKSGYIEDLKTKGTDEAENRLENIAELYNAILQFEEENETDRTLQAFLESASLSSDLDNLEAKEQVSLMTLHSAKGLEFPIVFLVGLEQGLFPHARSLNDPFSLEEERRLCYVGITRAQEQLFLTYTRERRLWGGSREPAIPSQFLSELPQDLLNANSRQQFSVPAESESTSVKTIASNELWENGDRVFHPEFGEGRVVAIFGNGKKSTIAVKFFELGATKILPTVATMQKL
ncbi:MAG: AAA family ATPase, partial [Cyanobacteria bacterium J083]